MKNTHHIRTLLSALSLTLVGHAVAADPTTAAEALAQGKVSLNMRARYEGVQAGTAEADAVTLRTRLGFTTAAFKGLKASVELENISSPSGDSYNQAGLNPGGAGKATVADPEGTEVNQVWLAYTSGKTSGTIGRQRIVYDNARFVGDVGWRQNMQTFDALSITDKSIDKLTLNYAYLYQINRVFGKSLATGVWRSDSHLLNASYVACKEATVTGYAYLLDFDNAAAQSCATYGIAAAGGVELNKEYKLVYRAEYATQSDYGSSALNYTTDYYTGEIGVSAKPGLLAVGYEVLGSDGGISFRTPLATGHAFNGWADLFLTTPANGIRDTYVKASANLPQGVGLLAFYHSYEADRLGADYGTEFNVQLTKKFGKYFTGTLKYADFESDNIAYADTKKVWVQVDFVY